MPKIYSVRQTKTPSTPNKTPSARFQSKEHAKKTNTDIHCFVAMLFLSRIYALFGVPFTGLKNLVLYQKLQIWGMFVFTLAYFFTNFDSLVIDHYWVTNKWNVANLTFIVTKVGWRTCLWQFRFDYLAETDTRQSATDLPVHKNISLLLCLFVYFF